MTDVLDDVRAALRSLLADRCPWQSVLARAESDEPYDPKLWSAIAADMGLAGLAVPERLGGAGAGFGAAAVVLEELGRALAPVPYLGSAVIATRALLAAGTEEADDLLRRLADGSATAALAIPFTGQAGSTTRITSVADALPATHLLVPAADGLYLVPAEAARRTPVTSLDATRQLCDIDVDLSQGALISRDPGAVAKAVTTGAALLASEQVGVGQWCLDTTVAYTKQRYQFGRPVGSFQAVKHRLADLWVELTQARAVAAHAAANPDDAVAAALAQAFCGPAALLAARECVQLHGGTGFTWEHPAHLYLKRATAAAIALGTADRHRAHLGRLTNLQPPIDGSTEKSTLLV